MEQKPETQEDVIHQIIENVDNNFEKRLRKIYLPFKIDLRYYVKILVVFYYIIVFSFAGALLLSVTKALPYVSQQPPSTQIVIDVAITAAFIALASFGINLQNIVKPVEPYDILFEFRCS